MSDALLEHLGSPPGTEATIEVKLPDGSTTHPDSKTLDEILARITAMGSKVDEVHSMSKRILEWMRRHLWVGIVGAVIGWFVKDG